MESNAASLLDRRRFLKMAAVSVGGLLLGPSQPAQAAQVPEGELGILYDASKCIGCRKCEEACKAYNGLPEEPTRPSELSADTWNLIVQREGVDRADDPFFLRQCMHCTDAACVSVCPTGALYKDERGFVALDAELCNGCGYCTQFCPFGVPHLGDVDLVTGAAQTAKCTFCQAKVWSGEGGPSCAEACPTGALTWGNRQELVAQAQDRVDELREEGRGTARLYGLEQAGGLHRVSILLDQPAAYGLPDQADGPFIFSAMWQRVIQPLGGVAVGATGLGLVLNWLVARTQIKAEEQ